ncbi:MAG: DinB family protein [Anaerolineales bacterium]|nr:DinB family protein [Anaerolineales bacterium]
MGDRVQRLTGRLKLQGEKTVALFRGIPDGAWKLEVYSEGASWEVKEVLMHFVSSERGVARLVSQVVAGGAGVPEDFDLDRYNEGRVDRLEGNSPGDLIDMFSEARAATIDLVITFSDADLNRVGRHPFLGLTTVESMIQMMYRHNQIHQRDLRRLLSTQT